MFEIDTIKVDVVIPSKSDSHIVPIMKNCIDSLRKSEENISFNIIVIESGADIIELGQDLTINFDQEKFNYNHALNQGLSVCENEWVILANNDLIFHKGFMLEILLAHAKRPDFLSFSPWNNMWAWHQRAYSLEFNFKFPDIIEGYRICYEIAGWCIIAKREIFNTISLSERVDFWYSDNVYADSLIANNIRHALVTKSKVDHITSQTKIVSPIEAAKAYQDYILNL